MRVLLAAAVVATAGTITGTALAASAAPASRQVVLVNQCTGQGQVRPHPTIPLPDCMTSSELIGRANWASWRSVAFGSADLEVNNCNPSSSSVRASTPSTRS